MPRTREPVLDIHPLTPTRMDDLGAVFAGSWARSCWCMHPRLKDAEQKALPGSGPLKARRRAAMTALAGENPAPGLIAYQDGQPVGWVALGPRGAYHRVDLSRATPPVDEVPVWIIPCVTVAKTARGQGVAVALLKAAVAYAAKQGAPAVEAYPRAGTAHSGDDNVYFGTEPLFRRAGFKVVRGPLENRPRSWLPRVTMRIKAAG